MYNQGSSTQGSKPATPGSPSTQASTASAPSKPSSNAPPKQQQAKKGGTFPIIPAVIIVLILVIGAAGFLYFKSSILKAPTTSIPTTSTAIQSSVGAINGCQVISSAGEYFVPSDIKTGIISGSCINVTTSNVSVICDSSKIVGSGPFEGIPPFTYAISINGQSNVTVSGCDLTNFSYGIFATASKNLVIKNNNLSVNYMADIYLNNTRNSTIQNNYLSMSSSTQGSLFLTNGSTGVKVLNNTIQYDQYYGINVNSSDDTFQNN
jgi:parallel beta-helix repeat protein